MPLKNHMQDTRSNPDLTALGWAIASFFESREKSSDAHALGAICERLAIKSVEGISHLIPGEYVDLYPDPRDFSAVGNPEEDRPLIITEKGNLYFQRFYEYERKIARTLASLAHSLPSELDRGTLEFFDRYLRKFLDPDQALAIGVGLQRNLFLLTGGPGTGKTRTLAYFLACVVKEDPETSVALCAPTGKAADRMSRSILQAIDQAELPHYIAESMRQRSTATTLHRLLGPIHGSVEFRRNSGNPLACQLVVVDEASMVDLPLMAKLCDALPCKAKLVLCGDADQLSPVQGGAVFSGLIKGAAANRFTADQLKELSFFSDSISEASDQKPLDGCIVSLTRGHRREGSAKGDRIANLCSAIRKGESEEALAIFREGGEKAQIFESIQDPSLDFFVRDGFSRFNRPIRPDHAIRALGDFRILCAQNHGIHGVEAWNKRAQSLLVQGDDIPIPMIIGANDYSTGLFNGDDGIILGNRAFFWGIEQLRTFSRSRLPKFSLGYACSIHRSQGSEYEQVLVVLPPADSRLLSRELLYVALSRAKSKVVLVGSSEAFLRAVDNVSPSRTGVFDFF